MPDTPGVEEGRGGGGGWHLLGGLLGLHCLLALSQCRMLQKTFEDRISEKDPLYGLLDDTGVECRRRGRGGDGTFWVVGI